MKFTIGLPLSIIVVVAAGAFWLSRSIQETSSVMIECRARDTNASYLLRNDSIEFRLLWPELRPMSFVERVIDADVPNVVRAIVSRSERSIEEEAYRRIAEHPHAEQIIGVDKTKYVLEDSDKRRNIGFSYVISSSGSQPRAYRCHEIDEQRSGDFRVLHCDFAKQLSPQCGLFVRFDPAIGANWNEIEARVEARVRQLVIVE